MWSRTLAVCSLVSIAPVTVYGCDYLSPFPHRSSCYDYYSNYNYAPELSRDLSRLEGELRRQRLAESQEIRQLDREVEALRQQAFANQQVSAAQACYYRTTGGFELCADLFEKDAQERERCEALVVQRNPGCNELPARSQ